jgi:hypothetical protein
MTRQNAPRAIQSNIDRALVLEVTVWNETNRRPARSRAKEVSMHMKVSAEQFVVDGDKLVHSPKGATFWLGEKGVALCDAGSPDLASGHNYSTEESKNEAWRIIVARKAVI